MRLRKVPVVFAAVVACGNEIGQGEDRAAVATAGQLAIFDAYAPASPAPDIASLYFTVINFGTTADTLRGVTTDLGSAQLHTVITEGARSTMRNVPALPIGPHDTVRLAPGGYHVMITGLHHPLAVGDSLPVTLTFARGGSVNLEALVLTYTDVLERLQSADRPEP